MPCRLSTLGFFLLFPRAFFVYLSIDLFCQFGYFFVGFLFFSKSLIQQRSVFGFAENFGEFGNRPIRGNLVMFHSLGCAISAASSTALSKSSSITSDPSLTKPSMATHFLPFGLSSR